MFPLKEYDMMILPHKLNNWACYGKAFTSGKTLSPLRFPRDKPKVCVATNGVAFFVRGSVWSHALFIIKKEEVEK